MMMIYMATDGTAFRGRTAKEVVSRMRRNNWSAPDRKQEYMEQVSTRVAQMFGEIVHVDSAETFLRDLVRVGMLERQA
jgi:hypothetical protein